MMKLIEEKIPGCRFLVTGGAGFIGSNLVEYLVRNGAAKVVILDNLSTGFLHNIEPFLNLPQVSFVEGDIRDLAVCQQACTDIDYVLHQAALGSVPRSINDPITSNEVNVSGFLNMLVAVRDQKVKRFVYAASSSTYGDSAVLPKTEDVIGRPLSPYAVTKYVNELYAHVFALNYGVESIGLRYFNVFGKRQNPEGAYAAVIPKFILSIMAGKSPVINGDGSYSRDFTFVDNVVQMNMNAVFAQSTDAVNQVYNTACGEQTTLIELFQLIKNNLVQKDPGLNQVQLEFGPFRKGDIPHSLANIEKAQHHLGYHPAFTIKAGMKETCDWFWDTYHSK